LREENTEFGCIVWACEHRHDSRNPSADQSVQGLRRRGSHRSAGAPRQHPRADRSQLTPTSGQILFNGDDITRAAPAAIARRGIIRSFQISAVFPHLSVLENVRVALQRKLGNSFHFWQSEHTLEKLNARALELLAEVDLGPYAAAVTVELSYGRKRALEIATTLAMDPELMLLDEPTQGMGLEDVDRIRQLIQKVAVNRTVLMVEHNMSVVSSIADVITVLARGATLAEGPYAEVSRNPAVIEAYMGSADAELGEPH
jgi:branched-chain amino acid transport system ATP-binding protein